MTVGELPKRPSDACLAGIRTARPPDHSNFAAGGYKEHLCLIRQSLVFLTNTYCSLPNRFLLNDKRGKAPKRNFLIGVGPITSGLRFILPACWGFKQPSTKTKSHVPNLQTSSSSASLRCARHFPELPFHKSLPASPRLFF